MRSTSFSTPTDPLVSSMTGVASSLGLRAGGLFSSAVIAHSGRTLLAAGDGCLTAVKFAKGLRRHGCSVFRVPAKSTANACEEKNHIRKPSERTMLWKV